MMENVLRIYKLFYAGMNDTSHILGQVIYKFYSSKFGKLKTLLLATPVLLVFLISFNIIDLFIKAQDSGALTSFSETMFQQILLLSSSNGGTDVISIILWGSTIASIVLPLVSNSILSSYNKSSLVGVVKNDVHKITDSIVLQYSSILSIMQLIGMIIFFGVIKYSFNYDSRIYLIPLMIWIIFGLATIFMSWFMDYLLRKHGAGVKFLFLAFVASLACYMFFLTPSLSKNFFGLASIIQLSFSDSWIMLSFIVVSCLITAFLIYGIMYFGLLTINTTAPITTAQKPHKYKFVRNISLAYRILLRNGNIRVPIFMMLIIIIVTMLLNGQSPTLFAFIFALPMVITMSFMVNIYGVTGYGNSWLFSLKGFSHKSLMFFSSVNLSIIALCVGIVSFISTIMGVLKVYDSLRFFVASMMAAILMTALASLYAITQPNKYDVHVRGENILPPSKSLMTLGTLVVVGGLPSIYAFGFASLLVLSLITLGTLIVSLIAIFIVSNRLRDGLLVNQLIGKTN